MQELHKHKAYKFRHSLWKFLHIQYLYLHSSVLVFSDLPAGFHSEYLTLLQDKTQSPFERGRTCASRAQNAKWIITITKKEIRQHTLSSNRSAQSTLFYTKIHSTVCNPEEKQIHEAYHSLAWRWEFTSREWRVFCHSRNQHVCAWSLDVCGQRGRECPDIWFQDGGSDYYPKGEH